MAPLNLLLSLLPLLLTSTPTLIAVVVVDGGRPPRSSPIKHVGMEAFG